MEAENSLVPTPAAPLAVRSCIHPTEGEVITSLMTNTTYTMGKKIGEGNFGIVYHCTDIWKNDLAAKVLKPNRSYEAVKASAEAEFQKLVQLRHPNITYIFDAFEFRDTFYIITERCFEPISHLFTLNPFLWQVWLIPIARCLLQGVNFLHLHHIVHQDIHIKNVFMTFIKDEIVTSPSASETAIKFKLADLGVAKFFPEISPFNTLNRSIVAPEVLKVDEFGPIDHRMDIYHVGLVLLQIASSQELTFTEDEILAGKPRELAEQLPAPYNFALSKALRRHVPARTSTAMELWRDLHVV